MMEVGLIAHAASLICVLGDGAWGPVTWVPVPDTDSCVQAERCEEEFLPHKCVMPTACEARRGHAGVCSPAAESQPWPSDSSDFSFPEVLP